MAKRTGKIKNHVLATLASTFFFLKMHYIFFFSYIRVSAVVSGVGCLRLELTNGCSDGVFLWIAVDGRRRYSVSRPGLVKRAVSRCFSFGIYYHAVVIYMFSCKDSIPRAMAFRSPHGSLAHVPTKELVCIRIVM